MEINEKILRDLKKKFELEMLRKEGEIVEYWRKELESIYKRRYENLGSLQVELKSLIERMANRVIMLNKMAKE